jgi:hypothetical protein
MITLKTLENATAQEVFDQVAAHMLAQNQQSMTASTCAYRGSDALKCAAGCLISDEEYNEEVMEGFTWVDMLQRLDAGVTFKHNRLIERLQGIHDGCPCDRWLRKLLLLADEFGLDNKAIVAQLKKNIAKEE